VFANRLRIGATAALLALVVAVKGSGVHAQDLEPRAYGNTPVDVNFVIAGYGFAEGGVATDAALPLEDFNIRKHGAVFAYVRSLNLWGRSGKVDVVLPYAWVHARAGGGGAFYSENDDFFGGRTREQEPIYSVQGHLIYHCRRAFGWRWTVPTTPAVAPPSME
jgi:hypothetical protein